MTKMLSADNLKKREEINIAIKKVNTFFKRKVTEKKRISERGIQTDHKFTMT